MRSRVSFESSVNGSNVAVAPLSEASDTVTVPRGRPSTSSVTASVRAVASCETRLAVTVTRSCPSNRERTAVALVTATLPVDVSPTGTGVTSVPSGSDSRSSPAQPAFWKSLTTTSERRASDDSARIPLASLSAALGRVAPLSTVSPSTAATTDGASAADRTMTSTSSEKVTRLTRSPEVSPRSAARTASRACVHVVPASMLNDRSRRTTTSRDPAPAVASAGLVKNGRANAATRQASASARSTSSGQCRMRRRRTER